MTVKTCNTCAHWLSDEPACSDACEQCEGFSAWAEGDVERAIIVAAQVFASVHRNATNSDHARDILFAAVDAYSVKLARIKEARLRSLGFEEPSAEERKANLALNVALLPWPK